MVCVLEALVINVDMAVVDVEVLVGLASESATKATALL